MVAFFAISSLLFIGDAKAGFVDDIPNGVAEALGVSVQVAGLILSCGILLSLALLVSMSGKKSNMLAISAVMLGAVGTLTAIGWLYSWLIVMLAILIALMFGGALRDWGEGFKK